MRRIISAAALMTWAAFTLEAEITARLDPLADGTTRIEITNDTAGELTAFGISMKETSGLIEAGRLTIYADPAIDPDAAHLVGAPAAASRNWLLDDAAKRKARVHRV